MSMTNTSDLTSKWESFQMDKGYLQRLDITHPLDFFIGLDAEGNDELALITEFEPERIKQSKELRIEKRQRNSDEKWAMQISSLNRDNREIFARLCVDLVDSSYNVKNEREGLDTVIKRLLAWQRLFANIKSILSVSVLKGLVGELLFARDYLAPKIGWEKTFSCWQGPDGADRDYVFDQTWFEIKTISTGKNTVSISSLNQLEIDKDGCLVVFLLDESSASDGTAFSVSDFINAFKDLLKNNPVALQLFEQRLINIGYLNKPEYDEVYFKFNGVSIYKVDDTFPKLVSSSVPVEIVGARYDIDLASIEKWKVGEEHLWN